MDDNYVNHICSLILSFDLWQILKDAGCIFQERHGWERPGWFNKGTPGTVSFVYIVWDNTNQEHVKFRGMNARGEQNGREKAIDASIDGRKYVNR